MVEDSKKSKVYSSGMLLFFLTQGFPFLWKMSSTCVIVLGLKCVVSCFISNVFSSCVIYCITIHIIVFPRLSWLPWLVLPVPRLPSLPFVFKSVFPSFFASSSSYLVYLRSSLFSKGLSSCIFWIFVPEHCLLSGLWVSYLSHLDLFAWVGLLTWFWPSPASSSVGLLIFE